MTKISEKGIEKAVEALNQLGFDIADAEAEAAIAAYLGVVATEVPASAPAPAGWRMVPVEPTEAQIELLAKAYDRVSFDPEEDGLLDVAQPIRDRARYDARLLYPLLLAAAPAPPVSDEMTQAARSLQSRVAEWGVAAFGEQMAVETSLSVKAERNHRFLEEALELVQSAGCSKAEAMQLVDYVFARPVGKIEQEVGGVMMCIALLCQKNDVDMEAAAEKELARIWGKIDAIRAKRASKPEFGPLPGFAQADASTETTFNG